MPSLNHLLLLGVAMSSPDTHAEVIGSEDAPTMGKQYINPNRLLVLPCTTCL
jgi:hypothetical protein